MRFAGGLPGHVLGATLLTDLPTTKPNTKRAFTTRELRLIFESIPDVRSGPGI